MRAEALLKEYVRNGSERAFRELVAAYVNFVYATASRSVGGDAHLAQDIAQTVFIDLARKAAMLPANVQLGGWLHRHTCFVARKALRKERRRIARETQAMQLQTIADYTEENLNHLAAILDEVLNKLAKAEREAIILRFFEQHDFQTLGELVGSSEDAARMRVSRALEKMRGLLQRRGIVLSVAGLSYVLGPMSSPSAPAWLSAKVSQVALSQAQHAWGLAAILKHACCTRLNVGLGCAAALVTGLLVFTPRGKSAAGPLMPGPAVSPAEFAGITLDEVQPPPVTPPVTSTPAPQTAPAPAIVPQPAQQPATPPPRRISVPPPARISPPARVATTTPSLAPQPVAIGLVDSSGDTPQLMPPNSRRSYIAPALTRKPATAATPATKQIAANTPQKTVPAITVDTITDKPPYALPPPQPGGYPALVVPGRPNLTVDRNAIRLGQRHP